MKALLCNILLVCLLLSIIPACKKEATAFRVEENFTSVNTVTNNCKPVGLGMAYRQANGTTSWNNLLLKWYDDNAGNLKNVKMQLFWYAGQTWPEFAVDYGELSYIDDEIKLKDVFYNQEVFSVKLDGVGRPLISRYDHHGRGGTFQWDTTYYFYSSQGRIDSLVSYRKAPIQTQSERLTQYFNYDPAGNLVLIRDSFGDTYEFRYDYTQLNHGMLNLHMLSAPTKILEYLDLFKFEHHHQVSSVLLRASSGYPVNGWYYTDLVRDSDRKVTSYTDGQGYYTWYTAWDCGGSTMIQSKNPSREEFMKLVD